MPSIGLVVARFYDELAEKMEQQAREYAAAREAAVAEMIDVPGVYDTPLGADRLARQEHIDAVVVLGAVITGDTDHDQVVTYTAASKLSDVSLNRDIPVCFGVIGPNMSAAEASERIEYGADAMNAALDMIVEFKETTL
jgi:6,7-dimethyl-8-ribityllumazine synthase